MGVHFLSNGGPDEVLQNIPYMHFHAVQYGTWYLLHGVAWEVDPAGESPLHHQVLIRPGMHSLS